MTTNNKTVFIKLNGEGLDYEVVEITLDFAMRTDPTLQRFWDDGVPYFVHTWKKIDGTDEAYISAYAEALTNGLN